MIIFRRLAARLIITVFRWKKVSGDLFVKEVILKATHIDKIPIPKSEFSDDRDGFPERAETLSDQFATGFVKA
jgi:hypothetical protein